MELSRRGFLKALGIGTAAVVVPELVLEPRRRVWQVSRKAPVGFRPAGIYEDGIVGHVQPMPESFSSLQMKLEVEREYLDSGRQIELLIRQQKAKLAEISAINDVVRGVPSTPAGRIQLAQDMGRLRLLDWREEVRLATEAYYEAEKELERLAREGRFDMISLASSVGPENAPESDV